MDEGVPPLHHTLSVTHLYSLSLKVGGGLLCANGNIHTHQHLLRLEKLYFQTEYFNIRPTCPVLMQTFPALSTTPQTKDWSGVSLVSDLTSGGVLPTVSHMMERLQEELRKLPDACESSHRRAQDAFLTVISTPVHELPPLTGQRSSLDKSVARPNPSKTPLRRRHQILRVFDENLSDVSLFAEIRRVQEYAGRRRRFVIFSQSLSAVPQFGHQALLSL